MGRENFGELAVQSRLLRKGGNGDVMFSYHETKSMAYLGVDGALDA